MLASSVLDSILVNLTMNMEGLPYSSKQAVGMFTTISLLYKMLKDRVAMETYIKLSGKYSNHWNNPILRRVNAWGTGHFDKFHWALYYSTKFELRDRGKQVKLREQRSDPASP